MPTKKDKPHYQVVYERLSYNVGNKICQQIKNLACYLIDLSLPSVHVVPVAPSLLAASALCLTRKLLLPQEAECWTPALAFYSKYSEKDLLQTVKLLAKILLRAPDSKYQVCSQIQK